MVRGEEVDATLKFVQVFVNTANQYATNASSLAYSHERSVANVLSTTPSSTSHHQLTLIPSNNTNGMDDPPISPATDSDSAATTPIEPSSLLAVAAANNGNTSAPITRRRLMPRPPMNTASSSSSSVSPATTPIPSYNIDSHDSSWSPPARVSHFASVSNASARTPSPSSPGTSSPPLHPMSHNNSSNGSSRPSRRFSPSGPAVRFRASSSSEQEDDTSASTPAGTNIRRLSIDDGLTSSPPLVAMNNNGSGSKGNTPPRRRPPTGYVRNTLAVNDALTSPTSSTNDTTSNADGPLPSNVRRHRLILPLNSNSSSNGNDDNMPSPATVGGSSSGGTTPSSLSQLSRQRGVLSMLRAATDSPSTTPTHASSSAATPFSSTTPLGNIRAGRRSFGALTPLSSTPGGASSPLPAFPMTNTTNPATGMAPPSLRINIPASPSSSAIVSTTPSLPSLSPLATVSVNHLSFSTSDTYPIIPNNIPNNNSLARRLPSRPAAMTIPGSPLMQTRTLASSPRPPPSSSNDHTRFNAFSSTLPTYGVGRLSRTSSGDNNNSSNNSSELTLQPSLPSNENGVSPPVSPYSSSPFLSAPNVAHGFRKFRASSSAANTPSASSSTSGGGNNSRAASVSPSPPPSCSTPPPMMLSHTMGGMTVRRRSRGSPLPSSPATHSPQVSPTSAAITAATTATGFVSISSSGSTTARGRFSFDVSAIAVSADGTVTPPPPISPNTPTTPAASSRTFRRFRPQQQTSAAASSQSQIQQTVTNDIHSDDVAPLATLREEEPHDIADSTSPSRITASTPPSNTITTGGSPLRTRTASSTTHHERPTSALRRMDPLARPSNNSMNRDDTENDDRTTTTDEGPLTARRDQPPSLSRRLTGQRVSHINDEKIPSDNGTSPDITNGSGQPVRLSRRLTAAEQKGKENDDVTSMATPSGSSTPRWGRRAVDPLTVVTTTPLTTVPLPLSAITASPASSTTIGTPRNRSNSAPMNNGINNGDGGNTSPLTPIVDDDIDEAKQRRRRNAKDSGAGHIPKNSLSIDEKAPNRLSCTHISTIHFLSWQPFDVT
jgi:hypothetical protein